MCRRGQDLNDEEAKRCAQQLVDGHAVALWQGARMIATPAEGVRPSQLAASQTIGLMSAFGSAPRRRESLVEEEFIQRIVD